MKAGIGDDTESLQRLDEMPFSERNRCRLTGGAHNPLCASRILCDRDREVAYEAVWEKESWVVKLSGLSDCFGLWLTSRNSTEYYGKGIFLFTINYFGLVHCPVCNDHLIFPLFSSWNQMSDFET